MSSNRKSSFNQWVVGYFTEENKYSVIPHSWLVICGNFCLSKWPKSGNINNLIQASCEPDINWPTYPVKIVSEYFNSYDEAVFKERKIFVSTSSSETEQHVVQNRQTNKRMKHIPLVYEHSSDGCDKNQCYDCSSTPQTPIKIFKTNSSSNISSKPCKTNLNTVFEEDPSTTNHLKSNTISSAINVMYNMPEDDLNAEFASTSAYSLPINLTTSTETKILTNMSPSITHFREPSTTTTEFEKDVNQFMKENIIMILAHVKRIEGRLDRIEAQLQNGVTFHNTTINSDILSQLPMKTTSDVEDIESKCITDSNFKSQMRNIIFRIGGTNSKNFIKRTLQRLFTNELSTKYTWTGFRQHNHLRGLQIIEIIKEIAMNTFSSTESNFEEHLKDWFRHGTQRFGREKK